MACLPCQSNINPVTLQSFNSVFSDCDCCEGCGDCATTIDARCTFYTGPNLPCSSIRTNDSLEDILIKVDQKICSISGNYSLYDTSCLGLVINTEQDFVEGISEYACNLTTTLDTFINTTFENFRSNTQATLDTLNALGITCTSAGINPNDGITGVINKFCVTFSDLYSKINLSTVDWDAVYTGSSTPTNIAEGFDNVIAQIFTLKNELGLGTDPSGLPSFNNAASCLSGGTTNDSLVTTVNLLKARACAVPAFDINNLTWDCITKPSSVANNLQAAFGALLAKVNILTKNNLTFSADFIVGQTDGGDVCAGKTVSLAPASQQDKWVAVNGADADPGTLQEKLEAGSGISFDVSSSPGKFIINSTGGTGGGDDSLVKVRSADPVASYLQDKMEAGTNSTGITTVVSTNNGNNKMTINNAVDFGIVWTQLLNYLNANPSAKSSFCAMVNSCIPSTTTTTTTSTTSSTTTSTTTL